MKTKREAIAHHCGLDLAEVEDYRYHYGRTTQPVYAIDNTYFCAVKAGQRPAKHRDGFDWNWKEVPDSHLAQFNYKIFKHQS